MKMTIVLDTDDIEGLKAAHSIATLLCRRYNVGGQSYGEKAMFNKIELIKFIRQFAKSAEDQVKMQKADEKTASISLTGLRECKQWVEARWPDLNKKL